MFLWWWSGCLWSFADTSRAVYSELDRGAFVFKPYDSRQAVIGPSWPNLDLGAMPAPALTCVVSGHYPDAAFPGASFGPLPIS